MTTDETRGTKVRFLRAKGTPGEPDYDPTADDTEAMAFGVGMVGMSGWLECAECGDPEPHELGIITTPRGTMYAYALCARCNAARKKVAPTGSVSDGVKRALDRFVAAGEPEPPGWSS